MCPLSPVGVACPGDGSGNPSPGVYPGGYPRGGAGMVGGLPSILEGVAADEWGGPNRAAAAAAWEWGVAIPPGG